MTNNPIVETTVPEAVYTDRRYFIDYFYDASISAIDRKSMSTALLGQRRMGKTEIFKRVINRLFSSQNHESDKIVVPIYFQFPDIISSRKQFALEYIENLLRWYVAFKCNQTDLLQVHTEKKKFISFIEKNIKMDKGLLIAIDHFKSALSDDLINPEKKAVMLPRIMSFYGNTTIAMFLDEFQNTSLPNCNFDIVGYFQEAVESPTCPHFVTGSAVSILSDEILGRGALFGRFKSKRIEKFTDYYGEELVERCSTFYNFNSNISRDMFPIISERCGGNPFYITAFVKQAVEQNKKVYSEVVINELLAVDIATGFIWGELSDQVNRWIRRINKKNISKWILYLAAMEQGTDIDIHRVQMELKQFEKIDVSIDEIRDIMVLLARGDLLECGGIEDCFYKINDPILNEFLQIWGKITVEKRNRQKVEESTIRKYQLLDRKFHEYKGYMAEVYMIQILWNSQGKTLPGKYFHQPQDIEMPDRFIYIYQRHRAKAGKNIEIDIYASAGIEIWMAESKWWKNPVGQDVILHMIDQAQAIKEQEGKFIRTLRLWLFAYNGVTEPAKALMKKHGIFWSNCYDLNNLLTFVNLRQLPDFSVKNV
ncbi:ATPase domain protein, prokaryote domain protein [Candidatus Magnetomorum sp. HK-1]|nr:ATPase domain protein, prokaryote domain protein [Candidatus Magnetomorum sp. HK-1]